ncbi:polysaccharide biosynthesis/export family protein [Pseudochryseolinea flava]|nr:polysaccharide biosynthesis/export family protein [Pseudochryseolinea flava]
MFTVKEGQALKGKVNAVEKNYVIQKNDLLQLQVYTNKGEKLIDPQAIISKDAPVTTVEQQPTYLVQTTGLVKFPMIDSIMLESLTINEAEKLLQQAYLKYYQDPFVVLKYANKRVVVLGAPGGQVIPLTNENIRVTEILALAKGINNDGRANNIRILRGDKVLLSDFSTFEGYQTTNYLVESGDIIYVEPIRRPFVEAMRDYAPAISVVTTFTTLIVVIIGLK